MALCCATSSTLPLWAVDWENPGLTFVDEPNLTQDETGGGVYYIYHPATGMFLTNGNNHNTQLSVGTTGQDITLVYGTDRGLVREDPDYASVKGWIMNMLNGPTNSGFHEVYLTSQTQAWVDCNLQGHMLWNITANGDGTYRISIVDEDPEYGANADVAHMKGGMMAVVMAAEGETQSTVVIPCADTTYPEYANADGDWKFVAPEVYDVYAAKVTSLKPQLEAASDVSGFDYSEYEAIYNSMDVTAEEVETAANNLAADLIAFQAGEASEATPVDMSYLISDNSFQNGGSGWTLNNMNADHHGTGDVYEDPDDPTHNLNYFLESWVGGGTAEAPGSVDAGRTVNASYTLNTMPAGKYRLSADCFGVMQADVANSASRAIGVYLTVNADGVERTADAHTLEFYGDNSDKPVPRPVSIDFYATGGNPITVGFKAEGSNCNWVGFDNVKLEYMGAVEGGMRTELSNLISSATAVKDGYDNNNQTYSKAGEAKFDNAVKSAEDAIANAALTDAELLPFMTAIYSQMDSLAADVEAYGRLDGIVNEAYAIADNSAYADYFGETAFDDYVYGVEEAVGERTFDPVLVDSVIPNAERLFVEAVKGFLSDGTTTDATGVGTNMNFSNGSNGWTKEGNGDFKANHNLAEVWQGSAYDVYQVLTGLPKGTYKVTMQGFSRPGANNVTAPSWDPADPRAGVTSFVYANQTEQKLMHLYEFTSDTNEIFGGVTNDNANGTQITGTGNTALDGKFVCSGTTGAELVFNEGHYEQSLLCYVGDDGELRLGVKATAASNASNWALFDNFRVEYVGADMSGYVSTIEGLLVRLNDVLANDGVTTLEATGALNDAKLAGEAFIKAPSGYDEEACNALVAQINAAIELGNNSLSTVSELDDLAYNYDIQINETQDFDAYLDTEEYEEFVGLVVAALDYTGGTLQFNTLDEVTKMIADINDVYGRMLMTANDVTGATLDNPVDVTNMIQNPTFQLEPNVDSWEGWTQSGGGFGNQGAQGVAELYNSDGGYVQQTIYGLPQGYYRMAYNGFYRAGDLNPAAVARRDGGEDTLLYNAVAFARTASVDAHKPLPSIFESILGDKLAEGDAVINDSINLDPGITYECVANGTEGARLRFEDGLYADAFSFYVKAGESVEIGVRKEGHLTNDWALFDNFQLFYLGDGAEAPDDIETAIGETAADGAVSVVSSTWYTINGVRVSEPAQRGIYIRQDVMSDGTTKTLKVMVK